MKSARACELAAEARERAAVRESQTDGRFSPSTRMEIIGDAALLRRLADALDPPAKEPAAA